MNDHLHQRGFDSLGEDSYKFLFEDQIHFPVNHYYWHHILVLDGSRRIWREYAGRGWE